MVARKKFHTSQMAYLNCKCGEEEVVRGVHTLIAGVVQVYHGLHVVEEEEKVRKVEQEVEREHQCEETAHVNMNMEMG